MYLQHIGTGDALSVAPVGLYVSQHSTLTLCLIKVTVIFGTFKVKFLKIELDQ
jgi:hypothetical protein